MEYAYSTLLSEKDNIEVIREQIAALLLLEIENQKSLANEKAVPDARDFDISVFLENDDPLQCIDESDDIFPLVNVSLDGVAERSAASVNKQNMSATFFIDVYASGNGAENADFGAEASLKAWKVARIVRRILRAEVNTYLRLRGVVSKVSFKFQSGEPSAPQSAIRVKMVRVSLDVDYSEDVEMSAGVIDWEFAGLVRSEDGRVLLGV